MADGEDVTVCITGQLQVARSIAIERIATTNARFVERVWGTTDYLVAGRLDTAKARKATELGVDVITEAEFNEYVEAGHFPARSRENTFKRPNNTVSIKWTRQFDGDPCRMTYVDRNGTQTTRDILLLRKGTGSNGVVYFEAYDGVDCKTYRQDRVIEMDEI